MSNNNDTPPVQAMRTDTVWCKECKSLVQEKGHPHFNNPAKATISWTPPKEPAPVKEVEAVSIEVSASNTLDW